MKLNTAFLGVIAAALALPQIPAAHKVIHNNIIYKVQLAQYEAARERYKEEVKTYCQDNWETWVSRNKKDEQRAEDEWARGKRPQPGELFYGLDHLDLRGSWLNRTSQGCIRTLTESWDKDLIDAYRINTPPSRAEPLRCSGFH